eukprot:CAMPEP_0194567510 /NCGR_PEP_ID=MMETSP0292-20121207/5955_1 /TAXON_ID=39354 /ORGANISM="Heterosigma akashiwo, Strain CCMP2393" /LENGTH=165 /DNA_ID=CAMNT_0039417291 /DNA_START=138 /DNA_END=632 /DNA_ORIENTATION=+
MKQRTEDFDASPLAEEIPSSGGQRIDIMREKFPHCLVWCPLPLITWFCPIIGHLGIADEEGRIYDFAGPYTIGSDHLCFGKVTRYIQLNPKAVKKLKWDDAVIRANTDYSQRMHNICCDNCHSHVARALAYMAYRGVTAWNMFTLAFWMFIAGKYTSIGGALKTW